MFRALASEIAVDLGARSPEDEALMLLLPAVRLAVLSYYAGVGQPLRELASPADLIALDAWLLDQVRFWGRRWQSLDPVKTGSAPSTRDALVVLVTELDERRVPDPVSSFVARLVARACPTGGQAFNMSSASQKDLDWGGLLVFDEDGEPLSPEARKLKGLGPLAPPPGKRWVDVLDVELDYLSLVDAYLARHEHGQLRNAGAWWSKRVELLEKLLGFSLDHAGASLPEGVAWQLRASVSNAVALYPCIKGPFVRHLEGLPPPVIREFEERHRPVLEKIDGELRGACREVVAEVVRTLDPDIVGRRVRQSQLFDLGLDWWEPDELLEGW